MTTHPTSLLPGQLSQSGCFAKDDLRKPSPGLVAGRVKLVVMEYGKFHVEGRRVVFVRMKADARRVGRLVTLVVFSRHTDFCGDGYFVVVGGYCVFF